MRLQASFIIALLISVSVSYAQIPATIQVSEKVIIDNSAGYAHSEMANTDWGGSHGIFFGSKINYTGTDNLWGNGNAVYSHDPGAYNFGAFSMGYIANGGLFQYLISSRT